MKIKGEMYNNNSINYGNQRIKQNFDPDEWGHNAWEFIHLIALSYPTNPSVTDKEQYKHFFLLLGRVLPCSTCSKNYMKHWQKYKIDNYLDGPNELYNWTMLIRKSIKQQINEQNRENFVNFSSVFFSSFSTKSIIILLIFIAVIVVFFVFLFYKYMR